MFCFFKFGDVCLGARQASAHWRWRGTTKSDRNRRELKSELLSVQEREEEEGWATGYLEIQHRVEVATPVQTELHQVRQGHQHPSRWLSQRLMGLVLGEIGVPGCKTLLSQVCAPGWCSVESG